MSVYDPGSITILIQRMSPDDQDAINDLFNQVVPRLIQAARRKLGPRTSRVADEEDVVNAAFYDFCRGVDDDRFARLETRTDLWQILLMLVDRRAIDRVRREGPRPEVGQSRVAGQDASSGPPNPLERLADEEPSPEFVAQAAEEFTRLIDCLEKDDLKRIAKWKLEHYTNAEIARQVGCSERTVERKLSIIRDIWRDHLDDESGELFDTARPAD